MSRHVRFKQADVQRAVAGVQQRGLPVSQVIIDPDGTIRVLTEKPPLAERDDLADWRARRDARKASRS